MVLFRVGYGGYVGHVGQKVVDIAQKPADNSRSNCSHEQRDRVVQVHIEPQIEDSFSAHVNGIHLHLHPGKGLGGFAEGYRKFFVARALLV